MGATYTRQSSAGIVDGSTIEASDINDEFDELLAAFVAASGHTHDGTAAEGGPVAKLLGTSLTLGDGTAGTDITVTFDGETSDGVLTWMEDEDYFKFSDDVLILDNEKLILGTDENITITYDETTNDALEIAANVEGAALPIILKADQGDDAGDEWKLNVADGGVITLGNDIASAGSYVTHLTITPNSTVASSTVAFAGGVTIASDLTITGDDLTMATNTSGAALIGDGTNFNPVLISGDISIGTTGTAAIGSGVIVNADVNASAAIADSKLATISTAGKVDIGALEIDGAADIGAGLADADLIIVDDNASGTEKKCAMSRVITYVNANASVAGDVGLMIALG